MFAFVEKLNTVDIKLEWAERNKSQLKHYQWKVGREGGWWGKEVGEFICVVYVASSVYMVWLFGQFIFCRRPVRFQKSAYLILSSEWYIRFTVFTWWYCLL